MSVHTLTYLSIFHTSTASFSCDGFSVCIGQDARFERACVRWIVSGLPDSACDESPCRGDEIVTPHVSGGSWPALIAQCLKVRRANPLPSWLDGIFKSGGLEPGVGEMDGPFGLGPAVQAPRQYQCRHQQHSPHRSLLPSRSCYAPMLLGADEAAQSTPQ